MGVQNLAGASATLVRTDLRGMGIVNEGDLSFSDGSIRVPFFVTRTASGLRLEF